MLTTASVTSRGGRGTHERLPLVVAAVAGAVVLLLVGWSLWSALTNPSTPDLTEIRSLDAKLSEVKAALEPIATSFTSEPATGLIDVGDYRDRIRRARRIVDSTNDLPINSAEALEIRDLVLTGGAQVVSGMDSALDSLLSDETSGTEEAATMVEDGMALLQQAQDRIDALLGVRGTE